MSANTAERTLILVKPDGVLRGLTGEILSRLERTGLRIVAMKMVKADADLIRRHYPGSEGWLLNVGRTVVEQLKAAGLPAEKTLGTEDPAELGRMVREWNCEYLTAGPVIAAVLEGNNVVANVRRLVGSTIPSLAAPGTIRGDHSVDDGVTAAVAMRSVRNLIHASGNRTEAEYEIGLWFTEAEFHPYRRPDADLIGA